MNILAIDAATRLGWCQGYLGARPSWGSHDFGRGHDNGRVLADYHTWLNAKIDIVRPDLVAFESPFVPPAGSRFAIPQNALTIRRLYGFAGITEAVCHQRRIRCTEAPPTEITRNFLGQAAPKGRVAKKAATVARARALGFDVQDDDEGDALALWVYAESRFAPHMISERRSAAGLELDLGKVDAPRRSIRGASGGLLETHGQTGNGPCTRPM